ncbi:MAG: hypothetical protein WCO93_09010 [bacterium]
MLVYRFRLISEEIDNFIRDYDILPGQTFLDFHSVIMESMELTHCDRASFFMTDKKYKKDIEISLKTEKRQVRKYDEDLDEIVSQTITPPLMKKSKLKEYIEDPHQKMIYEFQGKDFHSFFIELFKIIQADNTFSYPRCVKKGGELPKQPDLPPPAPAESITPPKVVVPKIRIPKAADLPKPVKIVEEEPELTDIEAELEEIIQEEAPVLAVQESSADEEESFDGEEEEIEHIEDYDDIDNLERKYSGIDRESDDY